MAVDVGAVPCPGPALVREVRARHTRWIGAAFTIMVILIAGRLVLAAIRVSVG